MISSPVTLHELHNYLKGRGLLIDTEFSSSIQHQAICLPLIKVSGRYIIYLPLNIKVLLVHISYMNQQNLYIEPTEPVHELK